jgi:DNA-binding LacI/PurR family transcriptional regulator
MSDMTAIGVMSAARASGLRVPEDLSVVGFDDLPMAAWTNPPLTTVHQPMRLLGERACSMLLERIADPALPYRTERLPTTLVVRESCGCPPRPGR